MNKFQLTISSKQEMINYINSCFEQDPKACLTVTISKGKKKRSLSANALQHVWYEQIAQATGQTSQEVKMLCKLMFALPIVLAGGDDEAELIDYYINHASYESMDYDMRLIFIDRVLRTSKMTSEQASQYMNEIQNFFADLGVILTNEG
jgi:hypothetical protein